MNTPSAPHEGLSTLDFVMLTLYLAGTFGIALIFSKQKGSTEEFFLGGRKMPWFAVGLSIVASLMSTISYLSLPGEMIKNGIGMMLGYLAIPFSMAVVLLCWVPFFMKLKLTSAYEYLEQRFNLAARLIGATLFICMRLGWMGVVVYTSSRALTRMLENEATLSLLNPALLFLPIEAEASFRLMLLVILLVGLFATIYTTVGGMRAVIWTDVIQFFVLFSGALLTLGYIIYSTGTGPFTWFAQAAEVTTTHTSPPLFSWDLTVRVTMFGAVMHSFFWTICTHGSDQIVLQRYFSVGSTTKARRSYLINVVADISVGLLLALCGIALLAFYISNPSFLPETINPTISAEADDVFPYFIAHQLPAGVGGLILAALFAAAMSSIDSGVNSVSAVVTTDFFTRLSRKEKTTAHQLRLARYLTLFVGAIATATAIGVAFVAQTTNIMELMAKGFNLFLGPLAGLFFVGMFLPFCTGKSAIPGVLTALTVSGVWSYWTELFSSPPPTFTLAIAAPCLTCLVVSAVLGLLLEGPGRKPGSEFCWWSVMRNQKE
jgi:SSS family solute:Na+ symporter